LVDDELARAVRHESALAIRYWWGVGTKTVVWWRRACLLFGPYRTPVFKYGDVVICDVRGQVEIVGLSLLLDELKWHDGRLCVHVARGGRRSRGGQPPHRGGRTFSVALW
jgi:hypothetical protein